MTSSPFTVERVSLPKPLSPMQRVVVTLLGLGHTTEQIAAHLHIAHYTVRYHVAEAAKKIPGDLPRNAKVIAWARGAPLDVLDGSGLRRQVLEEVQALQRLQSV